MATSTGRHPMTAGEDHHVGFNKALEQALQQMDGNFEAGRHTVDVRYQLEVDVYSPGIIGYYQVEVTTS